MTGSGTLNWVLPLVAVLVPVAIIVAAEIDERLRQRRSPLRPAVTIQVINDELCIVLPLPDIGTEVNPPKVRPIKLIRIEHRRSRHTRVGVVTG